MKIKLVGLFIFIIGSLVFFLERNKLNLLSSSYSNNSQEQYQCLPCGSECDNTVYDHAGKCPHCGMELVKKSTIVFNTIQPEKVCDYLKQHPETVLLDVRTKEEFEGERNPDYGTLQNAINIPVQELSHRLNELDSLKNREIIVYCSHSHRSPQASYLLTQNGFAHVINMAGGMSVMGDNECKKK
ncbi:MAG TPA: rhodanese-like domain-containing protein [Flavisolibacter sp.]|nr:rhodanese-like domain-containing protein [Flavisolibacter sp.]